MEVVYGGCFNPPTIAHQEVISYLANHYDKVILIPTGNDYNKVGLIDYKNRVEMLNIIIKPYNNVVISTIEFEKKFDGTFQSLRELNHPVFACGDDCIDQISTWKEPKILLSENRFLVFSRNHSIDELKKIVNEDELLKSYSDHFEFVNLQLSNISSTNFRNLKSYEQLNEEVAEYIGYSERHIQRLRTDILKVALKRAIRKLSG